MNAVVIGHGHATLPLDILGVIRAVDSQREFRNIWRRLMKLGEEYGEALQAYLAITSDNNYKKLTPEDLREELIDVVIVALDLLCHRLPGEEHLTDEQLNDRIRAVFERKIEKWKRLRKNAEAEANREVPPHLEWAFPLGMVYLPGGFDRLYDIQTVDQLKACISENFDLYQMCNAYGYLK